MRKFLRIARRLAYLVVALVLVALFGVPWYLSSESGRKELTAALSKSLDRNVELGGLSVGFLFKDVALRDLRIANPEGFPEGALLEAGNIDVNIGIRDLLDGRVRGDASGDGLTLHIIQKGGKSNLDGFASRDDEEPDDEHTGDIPNLSIDLALTGTRVIIEDLDRGEKVTVDGVTVKLHLTNEGGETTSKLTVNIAAIDQPILRLSDLVLNASMANGRVEVSTLGANLGSGGRVTGSASLDAENKWSAALVLDSITLDDKLQPLAASLFPPMASDESPLKGLLEGRFELSGQGLTWAAMKPTLAGSGEVKLNGLALGANSLLGLLAQAVGRDEKGALEMNSAGAQFRVEDGWLHFNRLSASGKEARFDLGGKVSLDGKLDLKVDLKPLAVRYGGRDFKKFLGYINTLDFRIDGTTLAPRIQGPDLGDLAQQGLAGLLDKWK
ncbi:MAG: AsmA-like C-terminal region-containing protein [Planctomycetota bacterium]